MLFISLHHLVNEYRPHQAREMLRTLIEHQAQDKSNAAKRIKNAILRVQAAFSQCDSIVKTSLSHKGGATLLSIEAQESNNEALGHTNPLTGKLRQEVSFSEELNSLSGYIGSLLNEPEDDYKPINY